MKILLVHPNFSPTDYPGGSENIAHETFRLLKEQGHEVYFFAAQSDSYLEEDYKYAKYFPSIPTKRTGKKTFDQYLKVFWNFQAQKNFSKMLDDIQPDIIHIHFLGGLTYSILAECFRRKIKTVMTLHDTGAICPVRFGWDEEKNEPCPKCSQNKVFNCIFKNCSHQKKLSSNVHWAVKKFFENSTHLLDKISKFIVPSDALKDYCIEAGMSADKFLVVENFVDDKFFEPPGYPSQEHVQERSVGDYFLFAGALYPYKGVMTLLEALSSLPEEIRVKIAGSGVQEDELRKFASAKGLKNVEFLGCLGQTELKRQYDGALAVIVPSEYFEIFGLVCAEAFACAKPVLGSNLGGIVEIVQHGKTGFLFEPKNALQLANYLKMLWEDKDLAKTMGLAAREKAISSYTKQKYYHQLMNLYREIIV